MDAMRLHCAFSLVVLLAGCGHGPPKKDYSVAACIQDLAHSDPMVRATAASILGKYGAEAAPAVPALTQALRDPNRDVRICATYALAALGQPAQSAVPALRQALRDGDKDVRDGAAYALKQLKGPS
jgi:HEAT repeat protein